MNLPINNLGFILSLSFLFSCHKTTDSKPDTDTIKIIPKLSKTVTWTKGIPKSRIDISEYHYDSLNRVSDITYYLGDSINGKLELTYDRIKKFFYSGNEQQPYKCIGSVPTDPQSELYYFYNNGILVTDSLRTTNCNCYIIRKYEWIGNKIMTTISTVNNTNGTFTISKDSSVLRDSNLIWQYSLTPTGLGIPSSYYTYDKYKNPLYALNINMAVGWTHTPGNTTNNIIVLSTGFYLATGPNSGTQTTYGPTEYTYNYNSDSLPIDCNIHGAGATPGKINYYYKN